MRLMMPVQSAVGLFALGGVVLQFLVWVMPEGFRKFLNRSYQSEMDLDEPELTE
jgi:hypothetical protein